MTNKPTDLDGLMARIDDLVEHAREDDRLCYDQVTSQRYTDARDDLRAAIDKWGQPAHRGEPVALTLASHEAGEAGYCLFSRPVPWETQLYTAPQPVAPTPEDKVFEALRGVNSLDALAVWRAAEAAHDITQKGGQHD